MTTTASEHKTPHERLEAYIEERFFSKKGEKKNSNVVDKREEESHHI